MGYNFGSHNIDDADRLTWNKTTKLLAEYDYHGLSGNVLFQVRKGIDAFTAEKVFSVRRPNLLPFSDRIEPGDRGDWYHGLGDTRRVLFNLPALSDPARRGEAVWVCEGEKDATNLIERGLLATTSFGGACKWAYFATDNDGKVRKTPKKIFIDPYSDTLIGRDVVVLPDNDLRGRMHGEQVWRSLRGKASRLRLLNLPGLPPKGDTTDWLDSGRTVAELIRLADTIAVEIRSA